MFSAPRRAGLRQRRRTPAEGLIELDCHLDGSCLLTLDEDAATQLRDVLTEWLG